jgi:hydrogenase maturation protease
VYRVPFDQCVHPDMLASLHGFDLSRVLYMAGSERTPEVMVFGVEPARIAWGTELSPVVARVVPAVEEAILGELAG